MSDILAYPVVPISWIILLNGWKLNRMKIKLSLTKLGASAPIGWKLCSGNADLASTTTLKQRDSQSSERSDARIWAGRINAQRSQPRILEEVAPVWVFIIMITDIYFKLMVFCVTPHIKIIDMLTTFSLNASKTCTLWASIWTGRTSVGLRPSAPRSIVHGVQFQEKSDPYLPFQSISSNPKISWFSIWLSLHDHRDLRDMQSKFNSWPAASPAIHDYLIPKTAMSSCWWQWGLAGKEIRSDIVIVGVSIPKF